MYNSTLLHPSKRQKTTWVLPAFMGCLLLIYTYQVRAQVTGGKDSLGSIIRELEQRQPAYKFLYDYDALQTRLVNRLPDLIHQSYEQVLNTLHQSGYINYRIEGKSISIAALPALIPQKSTGRIAGKVIDEENEQPVIGATIRIGGKGVTTDEQGAFTMALPKGKYEATVSSVGYGTKKVTDIIIRDNEDFNIIIPLKRDKGRLGTITVSANRIRETGTNIAIIDEIHGADAVVSGISKEQISRSQDRDAAEVVRRISGVSIIQNRLVIIRGLPQRYNTVMLNNVIAPSFEPDSRAFSFDIMPSSLIDRIMIYKTAVPELPGDFAGGVIKVYTTEIPVKNSFNIGYSASANAHTTFKEFFEQKQGKKAWLGYDDGTYNLPADVPGRIDQATDVDKRALTSKINNNWELYPGKAPVDHRFNLDFTKRIAMGNTSRLGIVGAFNYSNTYQYSVIAQNTSGLMSSVFSSGFRFADQSYSHNVRLNSLLNLSLEINKNHRISFKNLYTHMGSTNAIVRNGTTGDAASDGSGLYSGQNVRQYILTNGYRGIYTGQLSGHHTLFDRTQVNWVIGYTKSRYDDPDQRYRTLKQDTALFYNDSSLTEPAAGIGIYRGRRFFTLPEDIKTAGLDVIQPVKIANTTISLKGGIFYEDKKRTFEFRQLGYEKDTDTTIRITENYGKNNSYNARNVLKAGYVAAEIPITQRLKLYGGLRIEDNTQELHTYTWKTTGTTNDGRIDLMRKNTSKLPSFNISYAFTKKNQLRAAYSKTLNRPEFREISTFYYMDMMTYRLAYGNEELKIQTDIDNYDLRFEHYPGTGEMFTAGLFYKKFKDPVEFYYYASTGGYNNFQWNNAAAATNYGAEVELMLGMHRYFNGSNTISKVMQRVSVLFNAAYIYSTVDLGHRAGLQDKKRPLYGQSPYLINAALNYTDETIGLKLNANYNVAGKRLTAIGNLSSPNIYEMPRHALDFSFSQQAGKYLFIKGGIQNILNARYLQIQQAADIRQLADKTDETIHGDNIYQSNYTGVYYTLGIGLNL
ncbi:TonB-dependent receptor [Chitinophaga defluvii]|uniref:TonB-dependent receptor n=1 Tax=Chitinophaga defluvii TaxID=3163343 RepID=A0ABV2T1V8_9BACT